ncbi:MAG: hypothetical protein GY757_48370 [bacterium]|nr:hypothetical protein [bacterium]
MSKRVNLIKAIVVVLMLTYCGGVLQAAGDIVVELRLYEGFDENGATTGVIVGSYCLEKLPGERVIPVAELAKEQQALKKIYKLKEVKQTASLEMVLEKGKVDSKKQVLGLNGKKLAIFLKAVEGQMDRFKVEVSEAAPKKRVLLETEIIMPEKKAAVLGFKDSASRIYFLAFSRLGAQEVSGAKSSKVIRPKLVHIKEAIYPEAALKENLSGAVLLAGSTNSNGKMKQVRVLKGNPILAKAAEKALLDWKYTNWRINGIEEPVNLIVIYCFQLPKDKGMGSDKWLDTYLEENKALIEKSKKKRTVMEIALVKGPEENKDGIVVPILKHYVTPTYPVKALEKKQSGGVILEGSTDKTGKVVRMRVLKGDAVLAKAAEAACSQWKYRPWSVQGVPEGVNLIIICVFQADKKQKAGSEEWLDNYLKDNKTLMDKDKKPMRIMEMVLVEGGKKKKQKSR